jgi:hypothetical protein
MFRKLVLVVVLFASILLLAQPTHSFAALTPEQKLARTYSTGNNKERCVNILEGRERDVGTGAANFLQWAKIFDVGWWIPVVPNECVVCVDKSKPIDFNGVTDICPYGNQTNVPLALNLIPQIAIRLYGMLASITIYGLVLVFAIVGIRFLIGGLSKGGRYTDTAKNLRDVFSALVITLTIATLFLQLLFSVLKVNQKGLVIDEVCIPPQKLVKAADGKQSCVNP